MMSLVEFCKTVPGDIFGISDYLSKQLGNLLILHFFFLNFHHINNQMHRFLCADGFDSEEDK